MKKIHFIWDESKNKNNVKKHAVSFEEASSVFYDPDAVEFYDSPHSNKEDRFLMLGMSFSLRLLMVCHCYRENDKTIRIISARKATQNESQEYGR